MNLKALVTTLVLGCSSVALADSSWSAGVQVEGSAGVAMHGDHDGDADDIAVRPYFPAPAHGWIPLVEHARNKDQREVFEIDQARQFRTLQLRNSSGQTYIDKIVLTFGSGRTEVLDPDVRLSARNREVTLPLQLHGRIVKIAVYGKSGSRGRYTILAA
jgi:hypothetical protein